MFTSIHRPVRPAPHPVEILFDLHPAMMFIRWQARIASRRADQAIARLPPHLIDNLGIPPAPQEEPEHPALAAATRRASRRP